MRADLARVGPLLEQPGTLAEVARLLRVQNAAADTAIVRQGQPGDSMFFIAEGEVEVRAGATRIKLGPGQFFGEAALITGGPRNATVVAAAPTRLLRLDVRDAHPTVHGRAARGRRP